MPFIGQLYHKNNLSSSMILLIGKKQRWKRICKIKTIGKFENKIKVLKDANGNSAKMEEKISNFLSESDIWLVNYKSK